jgi:predicted glutamine amidotransferase
MCRLLGVVSRTDAPIAALVQDELPPFLDLSAEHAHGWGIGWVAADGRVDIRKEPVQASEDRRFADTIASTVTDASLLHIRQASPGMPLIPANTHPFLADDLCFAHNGYAWTAATMDTLVRESGAPRPLGDTDSERYLSLVRASLAERSAPDALRHAAERIAECASFTSLNCLLLVPGALYALAWWHAPTIRAQPDGETETDYRLWYRVDADRVLVASAGMQGHDAGWRELPHEHVLEVRRDTLETTVHGPR